MKEYIIFEIEEINTLLEIAIGEAMRYEDMAKKQPNKKYACELLKTKWKTKAETFEEMLKYGKKINKNYELEN
jgi:hypothetical protein